MRLLKRGIVGIVSVAALLSCSMVVMAEGNIGRYEQEVLDELSSRGYTNSYYTSMITNEFSYTSGDITVDTKDMILADYDAIMVAKSGDNGVSFNTIYTKTQDLASNLGCTICIDYGKGMAGDFDGAVQYARFTEEGGVAYVKTNSGKVTNALVDLDGEEYYIGADGSSVTTAGVYKAGPTWYYVGADSKVVYTANGLTKVDGIWYNLTNGVWDDQQTTLVKLNGKWFYVQNGKWDNKINTLVEYNGKRFYVQGGKWNNKINTLVKYNGKWFYIQGGKWNNKVNTMVLYSGKHFYMQGGKWDNTYNGIVVINGETWNVVAGKGTIVQ